MLRFGSVPYLNARPLLEGLEDEVGSIKLAVPSALAAGLREGDLDVALAPVVTAFEDPALHIVPAGAVVARGAVTSVLLFTRGDPEDAETVALDTSSRTSAALVQVLYAHLWGSRPTFVPRAPDPDLSQLDADACLLIGDPALQAKWDGPDPIDLGEEWSDWTKLPFVFAAWLARGEVAAEESLPYLTRAAERGRGALDRIASAGAAELGLDPEDASRYLREHLSFEYGDAEQAGLDRFRRLWHDTPGLHADD